MILKVREANGKTHYRTSEEVDYLGPYRRADDSKPVMFKHADANTYLEAAATVLQVGEENHFHVFRIGVWDLVTVNVGLPGGVWLMSDKGDTIDTLPSFWALAGPAGRMFDQHWHAEQNESCDNAG